MFEMNYSWNNFFEESFFTSLEIVAAIVTIIIFIIGLLKIKSKAKSEGIQSSYIDYATDELIEEKKYSIYWGYLPRRKVTLPKISRESSFKLYYKSCSSIKKDLPKQKYEVKDKGLKRVIILVDKKFLGEEDTDEIYIEIKTHLSEEDIKKYREKIHVKTESNLIEICNGNMTEIHNYMLELPIDFEFKKLSFLFNFVSEIVNPQNTGKPIQLVVTIPAKQGNNDGKKTIPLPEA